jgi:hypothetical protein
VATEDTSEKFQGEEYPKDKWSGKASCYLTEVREMGSPHGQRVHGNRWTTSGSHTRRQRPTFKDWEQAVAKVETEKEAPLWPT